MRQLTLAALVLPFLHAPAAAAASPPEVLAWTTSAGAWVSVDGAAGTLAVPGALDVDVSPDGTKLAFIKDTPDGAGAPGYSSWQLWVANVDGTGAVDLTPNPVGYSAYAYQPQFSPDGSRIAYAWGGGDVFDLRTISATGGTPHDIVSTDQTQMPSWSPDGAFLAAPTAGGGLIVTPDGSQRKAIPSAVFFGDPAWSPDGTTILFNTTDDGQQPPAHDLKAYAVSTGAVTDVAASAGDAAWTADGAHFYDTTDAGALERRTAAGVVDPSFAPVAGADNAAVGGGARPAPDGIAPGPATGLAGTAAPSQVALHATLPADQDVAGVVVRYAEGATAPATVTEGSPGGRSPSGDVTVTRLLADTTYSFSVFAVDWSGNAAAPASATVTTPHAVATTYRTRTSAQTVVYGSTVTESARLIREDTGVYAADQLVQLFGHAKGQPDKLLATARTDATGLVQFVRRPLTPAYYTMRYNGDGQLLPASGSTYVGVRYRVVAVLSPQIARLGRPATLTVTVAPAIKGLRVTVAQVLRNQDIKNHVLYLDSQGRASTALDTSRHGNERLYLNVVPYGGYTAFSTVLGFGVA